MSFNFVNSRRGWAEPEDIRKSFLAIPHIDRPRFAGTDVQVIGMPLNRRPSGLWVVGQNRRPKQAIDAITTFVTAEDLIQRRLTVDEFNAAISSASRATLLKAFAAMLAPLETGSIFNQDVQRDFANRYLQGPGLNRALSAIDGGRILASCTAEPDQAWVTQQARNLCWKLEDEGIGLSVVVHDRDKKFAPSADVVFKSAGARVVLSPLMAPRANARAERWIGSCRRECLDWMLILNQRHLEVALREYCRHYDDERPHRSRNLRPPASRGDPIPPASGRIERKTRLGGLLNEYRPASAAA